MKTLFVNIFSLLLCILACGCAEQYMLEGTTTIRGMEGKMLYLKVYNEDKMKTVDSSLVTHGKFRFTGSMDSSAVMASLVIDDQSVLPVVIEKGDLTMHIEEGIQYVTGSELNDTLYSFIQQKNQIDNQLEELPHKEGRMIMDGMDHDEVIRLLNDEALKLTVQNDMLITNFIKRNYNNVLGAGVFMIMTSGYLYPLMTPQIEELEVNATPYFLNHAYVKQWLKVAKDNTERMRE